MNSALTLYRLHFAFTITYHYLFPQLTMGLGLAWWIPGMILVAGYFIFLYRRFAGKVRLEDHDY